ncbi:MAG: DUF6686 family protein [Bacteroidota bacterium]
MNSSSRHKHTFELLHHDKDSKIVYCYECQAFHVNYGTVSLDLARTTIESLIDSLDLNLQLYKGMADSDERCIEIATPYFGIRLLFSFNELEVLRTLLKDAYLRIEERLWKSNWN